MLTFVVQADGTVVAEGKPVMKITEHGITALPGGEALPVTMDGDTVLLPGVTVTVSSAEGTVRSGLSDVEGAYEVPALHPGASR